MSGTQNAFFLIGTPGELEYADKAAAQGYELLAGSLHVFNRLSAENRSVIAAGPLLSAAKRQMIVNRVGSAASNFDTQLDNTGCSAELRAIAITNLTKAIFTYEGIRAAEIALNEPIVRLGERGLTPAHILPGIRIPRAPVRQTERPPVAAGTRQGRYELDFRSPSGKKLPNVGAVPRFQFKARRNSTISAIKNMLGNIPLGRPRELTLRASFPHIAATHRSFTDLNFDVLGDPVLAAILTGVLDRTADVFFSYRSGMRGLLHRRGTPQRAMFNQVNHEGLAGSVAALAEAGVLCEMSSHGCLIAYGDGLRHDAARMLANLYNRFPGIAQIAPRSPLQAQGAAASQAIVKTIRLEAFPPQLPRPEAFRIYYAPNFQAWHEAYHGLVIDCFQTGRCIQHLTDLVAGLPGFTLGLRIKTTPLDVASAKNVPSVRGLLPNDVKHLIRPDAGIHDASWGSHKGYLADSDLVVTEGLTAVMFEALEMRKPVLLLNADATMVPSLPHRPVAESSVMNSEAFDMPRDCRRGK